MAELVRIGITHGDMNGVGYEVIVKALAHNSVTDIYTPVIFGYRELAEQMRDMLGIEELDFNVVECPSEIKDGKINLVELPVKMPQLNPGQTDPEVGKAAASALELAVNALKENDIDVLVTAPISKEAINSEEFDFPGHTEFLESRLADSDNVKALMILCEDNLRVALLTVHIPVAHVAENVTRENIVGVAKNFVDSLKMDFGCPRPTLAVLSLNPHAGDGGVLGSEEKEIIVPAIEELRRQGILAFGPFAADGFFGQGAYKKFDGILAMYHDQGLAPFKTIAATGGVNFTAGLPFVRTSPDHGTAFDIAWQGKADADSMRKAIYYAIDIFRRRMNYHEAAAHPLKKFSSDKHDRGERQPSPKSNPDISQKNG